MDSETVRMKNVTRCVKNVLGSLTHLITSLELDVILEEVYPEMHISEDELHAAIVGLEDNGESGRLN